MKIETQITIKPKHHDVYYFKDQYGYDVHFELEDAWKLFKEAGREHYTYKKQEKFLVSLFLNSHNDNLYKMLNSRKFFSGYEVYKTVNFI